MQHRHASYRTSAARAVPAPDSRFFTLPSAVIAVAAAWAVALACQTAFAADAKPASTYAADRAACESGKTAQDKATCLKEAGAAEDERKRNALVTTPPSAANATARCDNVPAKDKADCLARSGGTAQPNQRTTTSGSVAGGGVIRETTTTYPGVAASAGMGTTPVRPASAPK